MSNPTPASARPQDNTLRCPNDNTRMEKQTIGGVTIDRCNSCGRLWLDDGELQQLLADKGRVHDADSGPFGRHSTRAALGGRVCPRDGKTLIEIPHPQRTDVLIEYCPGCRGVLLDAGELRQLSGEEAGSWLAKVQRMLRF